MPEERVVVTGIGLVTPLGPDRESTWRQLVQGARAVRWLRFVDLWPGAPAVFAASDSAAGLRDPVVALALAAAREAVADAGLDLERLDRSRLGVVVGTSKGGFRSFAQAFAEAHDAADRNLRRSPAPHPPIPPSPRLTPVVRPEGSPTADERSFVIQHPWLDFLPHAPGTAIAREFAAGGPLLAPVAACATGLVCINRAAELIRSGECDVVLAGSSDASLVPAVLGSFRRLGVLARGFADPASACRPFDRDRSGFVVGEGAAILVLERLSLRVAGEWCGRMPGVSKGDGGRGRSGDGGWGNARPETRSDSQLSTLNSQLPPRPYAEWLAAAAATDPAGLTQLDPQAAPLARVIADALARSGVAAGEIDYVSLHGTATRQNDLCETRALRAAFGPAADGLACSSVKGAIGHLLGAAGSVETALALLALRDQVVPPTVNLERPDPACDLDYTPQVARPRRLRHALKLSLGFGGHLAAAIFRRG